MKKETLKKRLQIMYKGGKTAIMYRVVVDLINNTNTTGMVNGNQIRPCHTSGKGRYTSNMDYTKDICYLFRLLGVKFELGNDAPRGGKTGNFIIVTNI